MDKKKILSSLALAGVLTAGVLGANVNASTIDEYLKPVGVYKKLIEGKTVVPYVLKDKNTPVTVNDIKAEFEELELVNGIAVTDMNAKIKTGDTFTVKGIEYTAIIYGDVNKDGKISTIDASAVQKDVVGKQKLDSVQAEAGDVNNNGKITTMDALALQKYIVGKQSAVIDSLPAIEDTTAPVLNGITDGTTVYINLNDEEYSLPVVTATDDYDKEVKVVTTGELNKEKEGTYNITYTATDLAGNATSATLTVIVNGEGPVFEEGFDGKTIYTQLGNEEFVLPEVKATDLVDGEIIAIPEGNINVNEENTYEVIYTATDSMGNKATAKLTVVVDGTIPTAEVKYSTTVLTNEGVTVTIISNEPINALEGWTLSDDKLSMQKLYMENVEEKLMVSDLAGNKVEANISINNIDSIVDITEPVTYTPEKPTRGEVIATITANEELQEVEGWTLSADKKSMTKTYEENNIENVIVKDILGNELTVEVKVENIDKIAPTAEVQFDITELTESNVLVTLIASEELSEVLGTNTWTINEEDKTKATAIFSSNAAEDVTITDLAGNTAIIPVSVTNIDREAPIANIEYDITEATNKNIVATIKANEELQPVAGWVLAEDKKSMTKTYENNITEDVIIKDLLGHETTVTVTIANIDKQSPIVTGFNNGQKSYKQVMPQFTEGVATLQYEDEEQKLFATGTTISNENGYSDGNYILVVTDAVGNATTVEFTIDNKAPEINGNLEKVYLMKNATFDFASITATDNVDGFITPEIQIMYNGKAVNAIDTTGANDGEYILTYTATDEAGNTYSDTKVVVVDSKAAQLESLIPNESNSTKQVIIRVKFDEEMQELGNWYYEEGDKTVLLKTYKENGNETVEFKDLAGNITLVEVSINNIDSNAPSAFVNYSTNEATKNVIAVITSGEELQPVDGWTLSEDKKSMTKEYSSNTTETVTIMDLAGNTSNVEIKIDSISVTINGFTEGKNSYKTVTPVFSEGTATLQKGTETPKEFTSGTTISEEGTYKLVVSGVEGKNDTIIIFTIDSTAPEIEGLTEGKTRYKQVALSYNEGTGMLTKLDELGSEIVTKIFTSGTTMSEDGNYKLVVTDAAGNTSEVTFTIDNVAPKVELVAGEENKLVYTSDITPVLETQEDVIAVLTRDGQKVEAFELGVTTISENGNYVLTVEDDLGNTTIIEFTIDKKGPEVSGVENGKYYQTATPKFNEGKATLQKGNETPKDFTSGTTISEEGVYSLIVTNTLGNKTEIKFTIDRTKPVIKNVENNATYTTSITPATDDTDIESAVLTKNGEEIQGYELGVTTISEDGVYTLTVTDKAGNVSDMIIFTIDTQVVGAKVITSNNGEITKLDEVIVTIKADEELAQKEGWTLSEDKKSMTKAYSENITETVTICDKAGNTKNVEVVVSGIAKKVSDLSSLEQALLDENVKAIKLESNINANHSIIIPRSVTIFGEGYTITGKDLNGKWDNNGDNYVIKVYTGENANLVTLDNLKLTGANAGIQVNGSNVKLTGTIDLSGNIFGGIEVTKGQYATNKPNLDVTEATLVMNDENASIPFAWEDPAVEDSYIVHNNKLTSKEITEKNQTYYYLNSELAK